MDQQLTTKIQKSKTRRGLGLIETLVAMGLLVMAVIPLMSMVVSAAASRSANEYATVAANLAREGIEVVVAQRNSNWIIEQPFDNGMYVGTDYTFGLSFAPSTATWSFYNAPNAITDATAKMYKYIATSSYPGLMVQAASPPAQTVATPYSRLVTLDCICYNGTNESIATSGSTCGSNAKIGVRTTSTVQWIDDKGQAHNISAVENIYDWR